MRIFLTGATGFIGSRVAKCLVERGHDVTALVISEEEMEHPRLAEIPKGKIRFEVGLLEDEECVERALHRAGAETCIHLAWYAVPGKYLHAKENLDFLAASAKLAKSFGDGGGKRFVGAGTCFEYDTSAGYLSESTPIKPANVYAASKFALFQTLSAYAPLVPMSFAWVRFFYLYGPNEPLVRLVPNVMAALLKGERAQTTKGEQVRDFIHVDDAAAAVADVALSSVTGAVNVGSGIPIALRDLVAQIAATCGATDRVDFGALPYRENDPMFVCANVEKLKGIGWQPRFSLESGLEEMHRTLKKELGLG